MPYTDSISTDILQHNSATPKGSRFKQQNLPAWQPILTAESSLPLFFIIGTVFIPLGIVLLIISHKVKEFVIDYTYCKSTDSEDGTCADFFNEINNTGQGPVYIYYGLTNYYQNHRRYVRSRDDNQLHGYYQTPGQLKRECDPFKTVIINSTVYGYAPCGAIANSIFNDTFKIVYEDVFNIEFIKTGIALTTDKTFKFNNPSSWATFIRPPNWDEAVWQLDPENPDNNGYKNEDLIVWMRTAALPSFRKLYGSVKLGLSPFDVGMPAGNYNIIVDYKYPVSSFGGKKKIIISTTSLLGGKNPFLGVAYLVVGVFNVITGILFMIANRRYGHRTIQEGTVKIVEEC